MNITNLDTLELISKNFNINLTFLQYMANQKYKFFNKLDDNINSVLNTDTDMFLNISPYVSIIKIPKKNKKNKYKFREVLKISSPFNNFYKELLYEIESIIEINNSNFITKNVHGFVKKRNTLTNAKQHLNKKYIFKIDVENFFSSIKIESIKEVFIKLGCNNKSSELFSQLCSYNNVLKEGFNTSPMIANLYCFDLDKELISLSNKYNVEYTRYSDDITFSSNENNFPQISELESLLNKYDLKLNKNKTLFLKKGQSQYVTGLSISNESYPRVPRKMKRKIRQDLYQLEKYFWDKHHTEIIYKIRQVYGKIVYTIGIEKELGKKYKNKFIEIISKNGYSLNEIFKDSPEQHLSNSVFHYTDETDIKINEKHYIGLSVVSIFTEELKEENQRKLNDLKDSIISDNRNGLNQQERENIFHYCEDNIYVKEKYTALLRTLNFEAFIILIHGDSKNMKKREYQNSYYRLFETIMYKVLRRFKKYNNYIYPEENSKISKQKLESRMENVKGLPQHKIEIVSKDNLLASMPDYILGIFRDCIKKDLTENINKLKDNQTLNEEKKLNEIVDKIRLVIDMSSSQYFARQNNKRLNCIEINKLISVNTSKKHDELKVKNHNIPLLHRLVRSIKVSTSQFKKFIHNNFFN